MKKILIVDDELDLRKVLTKVLLSAGYKVICAENGSQAVDYYRIEKPDLVILDFKLPDIDGFEVFKAFKKSNNKALVIMLTAHGNVKNAVEAMKMGVYDYLTKPFNNEELLLILNKAYEKISLEKQVKTLQKKLYGYSDISKAMGKSKVVSNMLDMINLVAPTDVTVLLEGKTGTGKEWCAKLIHNRSKRSEYPFIAVDCGAIPETLFESELFGFEKGAFTGAYKSRKGKFELANQGTIFLDEINNLPLSLQAKLLRILEERSQLRLGSKRPIKIDVRLIVASNKEITKKVGYGGFRDDLFYRLSEFKINIPSLKEREDDIPILSSYFLSEANTKFNKAIKRISDKAMIKLINYNWPGNIRELKNVITRAVLLCNLEEITPEIIEFHQVKYKSDLSNDLNLENNLERIEKDTIQKALNRFQRNKTRAAEILGISKRQLYRKIEKYNLNQW